jgi:hypothetical protein
MNAYLMGVCLVSVRLMIVSVNIHLMGVRFVGVCLLGVYLMGMYLMGVHLTGRTPHRCISYERVPREYHGTGRYRWRTRINPVLEMAASAKTRLILHLDSTVHPGCTANSLRYDHDSLSIFSLNPDLSYVLRLPSTHASLQVVIRSSRMTTQLEA